MNSRILIGLALVAACSKSKSEDRPPADASAPIKLLGVDPEKFQCDSIIAVADLGTLLGGTAHAQNTGMTAPRGTAPACAYSLVRSAGDASVEETWSYDFDCRPGYDDRAEDLFKQFSERANDQVSAYKQSVGSGKAPTNDAGVAFKAPEGAAAVAVGKEAMDMLGTIVFIDDDSPCYARVAGPDAARRLALAQLVAKNLHEANAPMTVHGTPVIR